MPRNSCLCTSSNRASPRQSGRWGRFIDSVAAWARGVSLRDYTMLRAGGDAEFFATADTADELASIALEAQKAGSTLTVLGSGSNVLPADAGIPSMVVHNRSRFCKIARNGQVVVDTGIGFQELFLKCAQSGLSGLEFAVGIPGTLGGALASNAGAYRSCISDLLAEVEIVENGERAWVEASHLQFSYRDSILRRTMDSPCVALRVRLAMRPAAQREIYDAAREHQRQRISKQPPPASAGSFFKNVVDLELAERIDGLPESLKKAGVVPTGYLIEACGLKGTRMGGAMFGVRHANFILNVGAASATAIRDLASYAKKQVKAQFGVEIEEEVLYVGDWSAYAD